MSLGAFVRARRSAGDLVVQPRMGFGDADQMRAGLAAVKNSSATTIGTLTLDSYTRLGDIDSADQALRQGHPLNGYPLLSHSAETTRALIEGLAGPGFPVQVRHGSPRPAAIFRAMIRSGLHATEGGPVSYCLPYGRTPLAESVREWSVACEELAATADAGYEPHLETFGGCLMGQLCPPSMLVAVSVLEAMFFRSRGLRSVSVSYAQQTDADQDAEAVWALRRLCAELLPDVDWHVVVYAYMGLFPRSPDGARELLAEAVRLAVRTGSERLIVKTVAESLRLPTVAENVEALEFAASVAAAARPAALSHAGAAASTEPTAATAPTAATEPTAATVPTSAARADDGGQTYREALIIIDAVLDTATDIGAALLTAFRRGLLDIPFCLHPDNAGRARSRLDADGRLGWADLGAVPLAGVVARPPDGTGLSARGLMEALSHVQRRFDAAALTRADGRAVPPAPAPQAPAATPPAPALLPPVAAPAPPRPAPVAEPAARP